MPTWYQKRLFAVILSRFSYFPPARFFLRAAFIASLMSSRSFYAIFFGVIAGCFSAIGAVRRSQLETQTAFLDFKGQAALLVIIGLAAMPGILGSEL